MSNAFMNGKTVVITGAAAGVGRATAREFARHGYTVVVLAREKERLKETLAELNVLGAVCAAYEVDVADFERLEEVSQTIERTLGPIDIWINNATTTVFSPIAKMTPEEFRRVTEVTYLGFVYGTLAALSGMLERNRGMIVQVGSALSYRAIPLQSAYSAGKHAIRAFTDALRVELMHDKKNIHVTMVQLPALNTPQFSWSRTHIPKHPQPVPPIYQPEVAARAIFWAAHNRRREVVVGTETVATILMSKFAPSLTDRYLAYTGYESQFIQKRVPKRHGNLFTPKKGEYRAHGIFDRKSRNFSVQFFFEKIPLVRYFTNSIFGTLKIISLIPKFIAAWIKK